MRFCLLVMVMSRRTLNVLGGIEFDVSVMVMSRRTGHALSLQNTDDLSFVTTLIS